MAVALEGKAAREHEIFISYSRKDTEFVRKLDAALRARGREAWIDWEAIRPSEEFMQAIYAAIENADTFVFVISPASLSSEVCQREIAHAAAHNKRMVPIVLREVGAEGVPAALAKLNWIFFRESDHFEKATDLLISAFDTDLGWVRAHTRLLTRALEWEANKKSNSYILRGEDLRAAEQWLAQAGAEKERQPTALQTEYIIASRKGAARRQRIVIGAVSLALIVSIVLTIVALTQRGQARRQSSLAEARRAEAERAGQIALARQLAAESEVLRVEYRALLSRSVLLAVEAMRRFPSIDADLALRRSVTLLPRRLARMEHDDDVHSVAISSDGHYAVSGSEDGTARIWEVPTGKLVKRLEIGGPVSVVLLSSNGSYLAVNAKTGNGKTTASFFTVPEGKLVTQFPIGETGGAIAFSNDNSSFAVAASGRIMIGDPATGQKSASFAGEARALSFSPNGELLTNGNQVWDTSTGRIVSHFEFQGDEDSDIRDVAFNPDSKVIATGTFGQIAYLWDALNGRRLRVFRQKRRDTYGRIREDLLRHDHRMTVSFSGDGKYLVTAGGDLAARVWSLESGEMATQLPHDDEAGSATFTGTSRQVLTTGDDRTVRLWEVPSGHELTCITEDQKAETSEAAVSQDGIYIVVASGKLVSLWEGASGEVSRRLIHDSEVTDLTFSRNGKMLATCDYTAARLWDVASGTLAIQPMVQEEESLGASMRDQVKGVSLSQDAKLLATANGDQTARIWDLSTGRELARLQPHEHGRVEQANLSPDGQILATASGSDGPQSFVDLWVTPDWRKSFETDGGSVSFSQDGKLLGISNEDKILILEAASQKQVATFQADGAVVAFQLSPDGKYVAFADDKGLVSICEIAAGRSIASLKHDEPVSGIVFSADGNYLATRTGTQACIWEWKRQTELRRFSHEAEVNAIVFSPDATIFAAAAGSEAHLWDVATGQERARIGHQHLFAITRVAFSPDGRMVATAGEDSIAQLSLWHPQDLIEEACARLTRNLTPEEWRQYFGDQPYRKTCSGLP